MALELHGQPTTLRALKTGEIQVHHVVGCVSRPFRRIQLSLVASILRDVLRVRGVKEGNKRLVGFVV
jgi:hypothetical protein